MNMLRVQGSVAPVSVRGSREELDAADLQDSLRAVLKALRSRSALPGETMRRTLERWMRDATVDPALKRHVDRLLRSDNAEITRLMRGRLTPQALNGVIAVLGAQIAHVLIAQPALSQALDRLLSVAVDRSDAKLEQREQAAAEFQADTAAHARAQLARNEAIRSWAARPAPSLDAPPRSTEVVNDRCVDGMTPVRPRRS